MVIDAIRTALTAAAGTGGAAALLLAFRRQRHTEHAALETRYAAEADRAQREAQARTVAVTELYSRAVDQLGSEQAPVRLGGLYALERLAQDTPDQRQTITNVLCAYLRMPYTPPDDTPAPTGPSDADDPPTGAPGRPHEQTDEGDPTAARVLRARQEREVRLTAQRILATHLRPGTATEPDPSYWGRLDLDLTAAVLLDLDLTNCHLAMARLDGATFSRPRGV